MSRDPRHRQVHSRVRGGVGAVLAGLVVGTGLACGGAPGPGPAAEAPPTVVSSGPPTVAVLPWQQAAGGEAWAGLGPGLAGLVTSELSQVEGIVLVERSRLDALLAEVRLGESGYLDPQHAVRMGQGLGAELVVVGSYSVLPDGFVMDGRVVRVATGEIEVAGSAQAGLDGWATASSSVVEQLARELGAPTEVELSAAPLEQVAQYGDGVAAERRGEIEVAREAYARAGDLAVSQARLQGLEAVVARTRADLDAVRDRWRREALEAIAPDTAHGGRPTKSQRFDAAVRWGVLTAEGQWCALAAEQEHFLVRSGWAGGTGLSGWDVDGRLKSLELDEDREVRSAARASGDLDDLLYGPDPIAVRSGWLYAVQQCFGTLEPVVAAWSRAIDAVPATVGGDPVRFELEAGRAWLLARHTGEVPSSFEAAVAALSTRHAVERGAEVADAALAFELRGGLTDNELLALARAIVKGDPARLDTRDETCRHWVYDDARTLPRLLDEVKREGLRYARVEELGAIAWSYDRRGCLVGGSAVWPSSAAVLGAVRSAGNGRCGDDPRRELELREVFVQSGMDVPKNERALLGALRDAERCVRAASTPATAR